MGSHDAEDREARRKARASWQANVFSSKEEAAEADVLYWLAIPIDERAGFVWRLSQEAFETASQGGARGHAGTRLRRSIVRILRRTG